MGPTSLGNHLASPEHLSKGSSLHHLGTCTPCSAWNKKLCLFGAHCRDCHLHHPELGSTCRPSKAKRDRRVKLRRNLRKGSEVSSLVRSEAGRDEKGSE